VRLGAIRRGAIGGADFVRGDPSLRGFGPCTAGDPHHDWDYLHRTYCTTASPHASLRIELPPGVAEQPTVVAISARRADKPAATNANVLLGKHALPAFAIDGSWTEVRFELPAGELSAGRVNVAFDLTDAEAKVELDHVLILPRRP